MVRVVLCNCTPEEAPRLARRLVEERLAACVNIVSGVESYYMWEGTMVVEKEVTLLVKTTEERYGELAEKLGEYHSYEVPEIIGLTSAEVSKAYAAWVERELDVK